MLNNVVRLTGPTFLLLFILGHPSSAQIPQLVQYQGKATDKSNNPVTGNHNITFRFYDAVTAGSKEWEETRTAVPIENGLFSVLLGGVTPLDLPFDKPYWLSVEIDSNGEMTPRHQLSSAPYSYYAEHADVANTLVSFLIPDYITGCELEYVNADSIRVAPGSFELGGQIYKRTTYSDALLASASSSWLGGGSEQTDSWMYVYLRASGNSWEPYYAADPPNAVDTQGNTEGTRRYRQYSGEYYRCIGAVRNDSSGDILSFFQRDKTVMWDVPILITTTVSGDVWSSPLSCAAAIPQVSTMGVFGLYAYGAGEGAAIYIKPNGSNWHASLENGIYAFAYPNDWAGVAGQRWCVTDSSQQIQHYHYSVSAGGDQITIDVEGYIVDIR